FQGFLQLLEQPHVLDSDDGLIGEGFKKLDLRHCEGAHFDATCIKGSDEFPLLSNGNKQKGAGAASDTQPWKVVLHGSGIGNMKCAMLAHPAKLWRINTDPFTPNGYGYGTNMSPRNQTIPLAESQRYIINPTNSCCAFYDGIEDRLHIRRRAADNA